MKTGKGIVVVIGVFFGILGMKADTGNCLKFDGTDDYVEVADHADLDLTSTYTIELWFKADTLGGLRGLASKSLSEKVVKSCSGSDNARNSNRRCKYRQHSDEDGDYRTAVSTPGEKWGDQGILPAEMPRQQHLAARAAPEL